MARGRGKVRCLTPVTETVEPVERPFRSFFTPNWDKRAGAGQAMGRDKTLTDKGQVKVDRGGGVAVGQKG